MCVVGGGWVIMVMVVVAVGGGVKDSQISPHLREQADGGE